MNTCSFSSHAPHIHKGWITSYIKKINVLRLVVRRYETSEYRQIPSTQDLQKPMRDRSWCTRKGLKTKQQVSSHLERRPNLLQNLRNKPTFNYWALDIERLPKPSQAVRTGLQYNKLE
jgi:hypothetical protein